MRFILLVLLLLSLNHYVFAEQLRARDLGITPGVLATGPLNSITDVPGVKVGQVTLRGNKNQHTGVTAIIPAKGNLRQDKVPAAVYVGNGYGKMAGISQVQELGEIETPIVLTNTLNVAEGIAGVVEWTLQQPGNENVRSVNAVVGETNDGYLNDIRARFVTKAQVINAINLAADGKVEEGNVGAGTGTRAFGWKGGIGTSSRTLPSSLGGYTVGVLVQSNFGGILTVDGLKVGETLGQYYLKDAINNDTAADGSIMIVVATDAPLEHRNLYRLAKRAMAGVARTGASLTNGSGDYVIAFSSADGVRRIGDTPPSLQLVVSNNDMSPLFQAVNEATEEAIYNSLLMATDVTGHHGTAKALPVAALRTILQENAK
jgi:D-aminopeptidase